MQRQYWEERISDAFGKARQQADAATESYVQSLLPGMVEAVGVATDLRRLDKIRRQAGALEDDISRRVRQYAESHGLENPPAGARRCLYDLAARKVDRRGLLDELRGRQQSLTDELHGAMGAKQERAVVDRIGKELAELDATVGSLLPRYGVCEMQPAKTDGLVALLSDSPGCDEPDFFGRLKRLRDAKRQA